MDYVASFGVYLASVIFLGIFGIPVLLILFRTLEIAITIGRFFVSVFTKNEPKAPYNSLQAIGIIFVLGAAYILAISYYDYVRYGSWESALSIGAVLATPVYCIGEVIIRVFKK